MPRQYPVHEEMTGSNMSPKGHTTFTPWEISMSLTCVAKGDKARTARMSWE